MAAAFAGMSSTSPLARKLLRRPPPVGFGAAKAAQIAAEQLARERAEADRRSLEQSAAIVARLSELKLRIVDGPSTIPDIIDAVSAALVLPEDAIVSGRRDLRAARARAIAMWLCRTSLGISYAEIGRRFKRDRSAIIKACRKVSAVVFSRNIDGAKNYAAWAKAIHEAWGRGLLPPDDAVHGVQRRRGG